MPVEQTPPVVPVALCACDDDGPNVWCDVHGSPSEAWEQGIQHGSMLLSQSQAEVERWYQEVLNLRSREQAARPVLDAARAVVKGWDEGWWRVGPTGDAQIEELHDALAALGSAKAGAPAESTARPKLSPVAQAFWDEYATLRAEAEVNGVRFYHGDREPCLCSSCATSDQRKAAEAGAPAAEPAPDGWCCWPCARLARAAEPASDVQAARVRVAADMVRKALAYRLGVTGLCRLDTAADIGWLVETGRQIVTALDAAGVGAPEPAQDDEAQL